MTDFVKYIVSELKSRRLSKTDALGLIQQFSRRSQLSGAAQLHPLLHQNISDLSRQSYASSFSGEEFFLRDHQVHGRKVLPGVAYLEMARAALKLALPGLDGQVELKNVVWAQPVVHPENRDVEVALFLQDEAGRGEQVQIEVYSNPAEAEDCLHFQALAVLHAQSAAPQMDLNQLRARMQQGEQAGSSLYPQIARMGIALGPAHQGVQTIFQGQDEILVEILLPQALQEGITDYGLHPSIMDSAVQAGMALVMARQQDANQAPLPFALESLRIFGDCSAHMFAWVRYAAGSSAQDRIIKLDFDLCDDKGQVVAQMQGFSARLLQTSPGQAAAAENGCLLAQPVWRTQALAAAGESVNWQEKHILLCGYADLDAAALASACGAQVWQVQSLAGESLDQAYRRAVLECFRHLQQILQAKPQGRICMQVVVADDAAHLPFAGLRAMLGTASAENPKFSGQFLALPAWPQQQLAAVLQAEAAQMEAARVRYSNDAERQVLAWEEAQVPDSVPGIWRENGVYLITGGLGGIGRLFAREILQKTAQAQVILSGRAPLNADKQSQFDALAGLDAQGRARLHYRCLDLADAQQVKQGIAQIVQEFGHLHGILHSAGMIADNFILKKTAAEIEQVLAPKVSGTVHLDLASAELGLDFIALFSSTVAAFGNAGQLDYVAANGFMDGFAAWRNAQTAAGCRQGMCVALNWPLWAEGGMTVDAANQELLARSTGMRAMRTENGIAALHHALHLGGSQLMVVEGDLSRLRHSILGQAAPAAPADPVAQEADGAPAPQPAAETAATATNDSVDLFARTEDYLRKQFSEVLKLAPHKIDPQAALERYGIDSILSMDLTAQLEQSFGSLPKTLFFEYQTIRELTEFFVREFPQKLKQLFAVDAAPAPAKAAAPAAPAATLPVQAQAQRPAQRRAGRGGRRAMLDASGAPGTGGTGAANFVREPIAIVGLSGRYPQSPDLDAFWQNLRDGKDCITEVPASRWDWRSYYSEDRTQPGSHYSKWGGFITGVDEFDPLFFNIPPVDAEMIDPQERLFLQHAWMAIEDAGYTRAGLQIPHQGDQSGQVGVYVGVMYGEYQLLGAESSLRGKRIGVPLSYASIANRVSYVLNLHGPSMTLDTMCSSSLTAIHLACLDLKQGRTDLALAGGVNVTIHPNKYLILSAGQFISGDGHCQSFGVGGDGYIPGEGVGAVILKRLSEAERDGNHIYGVIKGSALNHGGKTNGYSVPNPKSQSSVIALALKEYGISPRHVSYIEAHGTGTKLGDPIEIAALSQVFKPASKDLQYCALGSAKSNIGHCESAAGIAGLSKVLLQMKHKMIVPSLHSSVLNPHIDFANSPFFVNQTLRPWERPQVDGKSIPRIAGISSFGAGGSNAHLIIEEYAAQEAAAAGSGEVIIVLSARTEQQLQRKAGDLLAFLQRQEQAPDLFALAYTLQSGREAMGHRLALLAHSCQEVQTALQAWLDGDSAACLYAQVDKEKESMSALIQDEDMLEAINKWIARKKLAKLAELWVKGLDLDWSKLHSQSKPRLISLPTYPFAKDRYWLRGASQQALVLAEVLHPLVHRNTSDFFQQSYSSTFDGSEFFLADHQIRTADGGLQKILPGVAYLEMVRAAAALALPQAGAYPQLSGIVWSQPCVVQGKTLVQIVLSANSESSLDFVVQSGDSEPVLHCQGQVVFEELPQAAGVDVPALQNALTGPELGAHKLYAAFAQMGLEYGPGMRAVQRLQAGDGQLLADLQISAAQAEAGFVLHPALLDSALQSALGLLPDVDQAPAQPNIPFALDKLEIFAPCPPQVQVWVRTRGNGDGDSGVSRVDLDLCSADGQVCVRMQGLASRPLRAGGSTGNGLLLAEEGWENLSPAAGPDGKVRRMLWLAGRCAALPLSVPGAQLSRFAVEGEPAQRYHDLALQVFGALQALLKEGVEQAVLLQLVLSRAADDALLAGLSGLLATARLENPKLFAQIIMLEDGVGEAQAAACLQLASAHSSHFLLRQEGAGLQARQWQARLLPPEQNQALSLRADGVYLITGGLGGLGLVFARTLLQQGGAQVKVVLSGRKAAEAGLPATLAAHAQSWGVPAAQLHYCQLDLQDAAQVAAGIAALQQEHGALRGIVHSAGMVQDAFLLQKDAQQFAQVLQPKVQGTWHLDAASAACELDFFVMFSSLAGALGNVGQGDYAAANGFMDQFALWRQNLVEQGVRHGKSISINWPLWEEGGMQLDAQTRAMLFQSSGMQALSTVSGVQAFTAALLGKASQMLVLEGQIERLRYALRARHAALPVAQAVAEKAAAHVVDGGSAAPVQDNSSLLEKTARFLIGQFAELMQMPAHEVDPKTALENYGMDSVLAMKLTNQLEKLYGSLSKTLFFEYQNIASLAAYLVKAFPDVVRAQTGMTQGAAPAAAATVATPSTALPVAAVPQARKGLPALGAGKLRTSAHIAPAALDEVAIIGVAGRYPGADNLQEFWQNLQQGRDCITEIPPERWDHSQFFYPQRNQPGTAYSKWGGFLNGIEQFDALFFNISPKEAELIDPQERLFLETVWEAIEDAAYSKDAIAQYKTGVYVGAMWGQYELYGVTSGTNGIPSSSFASIANRVSYFFNFTGPSMALDTMCSSSLTAIHLACEALQKGTLEVAIAGGVNASIHPNKYLSLSQGNFAATDGRCRSFGEGGDGYVPGEGVGALVLKSLRRAEADGDHIYALIKASSINHGGKTNGYTVPNPIAQGDLISDALRQAGIAADSISYIETHGTGTSLGDPIEMTGLVRAFAGRGKDALCAIGSVKSNIGHLESAAGVAAVTKVLLQMKHQQLVPSLHAERLNPNIDFEATPFRVQRSLDTWSAPAGQPRRAGVSSFGAGGANAHLILEEYLSPSASAAPGAGTEIFLLSAKTKAVLLAYAQRLLQFLQQHGDTVMRDLAYTLQVGRSVLAERLVIVADSCQNLQAKLQEWIAASQGGAKGGAAKLAEVWEGNPRESQGGASALIEGEAGRTFLHMTLQQRDFAKLAKLWISGIEIDWSILYQPQGARRLSLPTYPFARERYWINAPVRAGAHDAVAIRTAPAMASAAAAPEAKQLLCYRQIWQAQKLESSGSRRSARMGRVLLLGADEAQEAALRSAFPEMSLIKVKEGSEYQVQGTDEYALNFAEDAGMAALVNDLAHSNSLPDMILHLVPSAQNLQRQLETGVLALHALCQSLMKHKHAVHIMSVSQGLQGEQYAAHLALAAYCKSLVLENPKFSWQLLLLEAGDAAHLVEVVAAEAGAAGNTALRRYRGQREEMRLQAAKLPPKGQIAVRQHGVYLITGGLGGLGYIFSQHLARAYGAKLVLSGRSALDQAGQAKLEQLQAAGAEVMYQQADCADPQQAQALVQAACARFGALHGVLHSAGVNRDAFILHKTRAEMVQVFAAKIDGSMHLLHACRELQLDCFVFFSSVAGAFGNPGQADYAYANAFMDACAGQFPRLLSINWPFWSEGGMQLNASELALNEQRAGISALPTEQGIAAWEGLLDSRWPQGIVLYGKPGQVNAHLLGVPAGAPQVSNLPVQAAASSATGSDLTAATEEYLKTLLSSEIGLPLERIDSQERFDAFGVDSMMISRINAVLEQDLGDLPKTLFYEYATVEELAAYLVREAGAALGKRLQLASPAPTPVATALPAPAASLVARTAVQPVAAEAEEAGEAEGAGIAIIGIHARFPQSDSLDQFWEHLRSGRDLLETVPAARWDWQAFYDADPEQAKHGKIYCNKGGFLDQCAAFDAAFFSVGEDDARMLDPQERLFLQSAWAALEDAAYTRDSLKKLYPKAKSADVGVFVGVTSNTYHLLTGDEWQRGNMVAPGSLPWSIANRVSYFLDLQGPSLPVDTACSSSLVAIHMAGQSLRSGECQLALAGGVNLYLHPAKYLSFCKRRMLAQEGHCRSFGAGDDGFIPGEGVACFVLKPLVRAQAEGDHIYAVVTGSAWEHAGRGNGYSAPNPNSQARVIEQALLSGNIHPDSISFVEGHGTGTQLGDNLEVVSLTQAFARQTQHRGYCALSSVKANVGHGEAVAGMAGLIKIILQMRHQTLVPAIHVEQINPNIDFANTPFRLQTALAAWTVADGQKRRALINSFGAGGVNACMVVEEYRLPEMPAQAAAHGHLFLLSAKNTDRLRAYADSMLTHLSGVQGLALPDLCYTLQTGREVMEERLALVCSDQAQLQTQLSAWLQGQSTDCRSARVEAHKRKKLNKAQDQQAAQQLFAQENWAELAGMWLEGWNLDWEQMYAQQGRRAQRLSLPTYPFAGGEYWVGTGAAPAVAAPAAAAQLHPLLHSNVSSLKEIAFASDLDGRQFYGRDHQVNGRIFFPGAGFLELGGIAAGIAGQEQVVRIDDIVWAQPLTLEQQPLRVRTVLREQAGQVEYQVCSFDADNEKVVHSEGRVGFGARAKAEGVDLQQYRSRVQKTTPGTDCYRQYAQVGFAYGPSFQTIQELLVGSNFALSRLQLHPSLLAEFEQYLLHPCLIDGALQTVAGIAAGGADGAAGGGSAPYLPFALGRVEILRPLLPQCLVLAEHARPDQSADSEVKQFNIRLLSENGDVLVKLDNFYVRALRG